MDVCKMHMQSKGLGLQSTILAISRTHGIEGFFRGVAAPLTALTFLNASTFTAYAIFKKQADAMGLFPSGVFGGAACGPLAALVSTPFELVKVRVSLGLHSSSWEAFRKTRLKDLYRGHTINTVREVFFLASYFGAYETSKTYLCGDTAGGIAISGAAAGMTGWLVSFPIDTVKTNVQRSSSSVSPWDVVRTLCLSPATARNIYRGVGPSVARAGVVSASRFSIYEATLSLLSLSHTRENNERGFN